MSSQLLFERIESVPLFVDQFVASWEGAIETIIAKLPGIVGAAILLLAGVYLGRVLGTVVERLGRQVGLDELVADSPLQSLGDGTGSIAGAVGVVVKYYVIVFAAFVAVRYVGFAPLETWLQTLVVYLPRALAGVGIILVGVVLAEYAARQTDASAAVQGSEYGPWVTASVRALVYFFVAIIGLDMLGINLEIVYIVVRGVTSAIGLGITAAIALAIGVAVGFAAKEYADRRVDGESGE